MPVTEEVLKEVRAAFEHEPRINLHQYPVHMALSDGDLILEGEMAHVAAKKVALELAAAVPGVSGIVDRLKVTPAQRMGDGAIRDHVRDALLQEPVFENCRIRVWDKNQVETCREPIPESAGDIEVAVEDEVIADRRKVSLTKMTADNVLVSVVAPPPDLCREEDLPTRETPGGHG